MEEGYTWMDNLIWGGATLAILYVAGGNIVEWFEEKKRKRIDRVVQKFIDDDERKNAERGNAVSQKHPPKVTAKSLKTLDKFKEKPKPLEFRDRKFDSLLAKIAQIEKEGDARAKHAAASLKKRVKDDMRRRKRLIDDAINNAERDE
ncbi:hypothetical protein OAJ79_00875 [Verrucomicrobia bacterium]|nr:hypothetical protein [Verrucomicrobiota bacterium]